MVDMQLYVQVLSFVLRVADETPEAEDVKAGWPALGLFLLLAAAVVFLGFSLSKQLRKAAAAKEAGVYDDADKRDTHPTP
jgi:hypothetical protein